MFYYKRIQNVWEPGAPNDNFEKNPKKYIPNRCNKPTNTHNVDNLFNNEL